AEQNSPNALQNEPETKQPEPVAQQEMEDAEHPHKENAGSAQDHASDSETGETADPLIKVNSHRIITSTSRACDHLMIDLETMGKNPDAP
ncbi:exonuclease, partial [Escherichia coli]|nr:exonuclease [Escherichia coli]MBA5844658.1 exonuclease [Escherichia coli]